MIVSNVSRFNCVLSYFQDNFLSGLTYQQKKVAMIATAVFAGLALLCFAAYYYCKGKKGDPKDSTSSEKSNSSPEALTALPDATPQVENSEDEPSEDSVTELGQSNERPSTEDQQPSSDVDKTKHNMLSSAVNEESKSQEPLQNPISPVTEKVDAEIHEIPKEEVKVVPYEAPNLLAFGKARIGVDGEEAPTFMGLKVIADGSQIISMEKLWAGSFACCFHTTESQKEILEFLRDLGTKNDPRKGIYKLPENTKRPDGPWLNHMYNHLANLHAALPGESKAKSAKIYWSDSLENILFPHFFNEKPIQTENLLFAIVEGEKIDSPYQDPKINFDLQLQFVGMDKIGIMKKLREEIDRLFQTVGGGTTYEEVEKEYEKRVDEKNPLMKDAYTYTFQQCLRSYLLNLEKDNTKWMGTAVKLIKKIKKIL